MKINNSLSVAHRNAQKLSSHDSGSHVGLVGFLSGVGLSEVLLLSIAGDQELSCNGETFRVKLCGNMLSQSLNWLKEFDVQPSL